MVKIVGLLEEVDVGERQEIFIIQQTHAEFIL